MHCLVASGALTAMFKKLLVANRGEIAVRVMRTCRDMGIPTVAVYADGDREAFHVRLADEAYALGGTTPTDSYLSVAALLGALSRSGADALHPGYGFLSENASFARAITDAGVAFIGPPESVIELMGDKVAARRSAAAAGVGAVPGLSESVTSATEVKAFAEHHGWPVAVKATHGGGGRGLRVIGTDGDVTAAIESAQREALAYFGHADVYVERYLQWPRHIEVQVLADAHGNVVTLGTRDCSVQRRHQKLVEESPAPGLTVDAQRRVADAAKAVARGCGYVNAGTVEFLFEDDEFYFLEMNTRLQVEHPVTEMVTGLDLVEWQIRVAAGERLDLPASALDPTGHAIEVRINAEDPSEGRFHPSPGHISRLRLPSGPGVRVDSGYEVGDDVSATFDNLVAKVVTWGPDRESARRRMLRALDEIEVSGIRTTAPAYPNILSHRDFIDAVHSTRWLEDRVSLAAFGSDPAAPHSAADVQAAVSPVEFTAEIDGQRHRMKVWLPESIASLTTRRAATPRDGTRQPFMRRPAPSTSTTRAPRLPSARPAPAPHRRSNPEAGAVVAPMQGTVLRILVAEGDVVEAGQPLCILEAMKMETPVVATSGGTVVTIAVAAGDTVNQGDIVAVVS